MAVVKDALLARIDDRDLPARLVPRAHFRRRDAADRHRGHLSWDRGRLGRTAGGTPALRTIPFAPIHWRRQSLADGPAGLQKQRKSRFLRWNGLVGHIKYSVC